MIYELLGGLKPYYRLASNTEYAASLQNGRAIFDFVLREVFLKAEVPRP